MVLDANLHDLTFVSSWDGSVEPALLYLPEGAADVPLLVGLHTWSYDRFNQVEQMLPLCRERRWALLLPEFRGANLGTNPRSRQACGSEAAVRDVLDAVDHVRAEYGVGQQALFLLGGSGGGHMALMLAARRPELWTGVSSWVPITDLAAWHGENPDYAPNIEACCGGAPGSSAETDREFWERSPMSQVRQLAQANLSLHHGRHDPVVPYRQSWRLAQALEEIGAERFFFEIFAGAHDIHYDVAFRWFESQLGPGNCGRGGLSG